MHVSNLVFEDGLEKTSENNVRAIFHIFSFSMQVTIVLWDMLCTYSKDMHDLRAILVKKIPVLKLLIRGIIFCSSLLRISCIITGL